MSGSHESIAAQRRRLQSQSAGDDGACVREALQRIASRDASLHSCTQVFDTVAEDPVSHAPAATGAAPRAQPLAGIPYVVKENIATRLGRTTCGSHLLRDYASPFDATVVRRLQDAGAVLVGKANCDEFAMGSSTEFSAFGPTLNPWDATRVAGGSSGGSAAAVAAGLATFALGSDTGGSVRQPAAWCGVVGFKPTWGAVSRHGLVSFANSLDHIGVMARCVDDVQRVFVHIAGADAADATSGASASPAAKAEEPERHKAAAPVEGLRIGVPWEWIETTLEPALRPHFAAVASRLAQAGATLVPVSLPRATHASRCYHVLAAAEATTQLARYDGLRFGVRVPAASWRDVVRQSRTTGLGPEVKRRILLGAFVLTQGHQERWWQRAQTLRRQLRQDVTACWQACTSLLLPTTPTTATRLGELAADPLRLAESDAFTTLANLTGTPAISLPSGWNHDLPVGVQLLAPVHADATLLQQAAWVEDQLAFEPRERGA